MSKVEKNKIPNFENLYSEGENGAQSVEQSSKFPRKKWLGTAGIPKTHLMRSEKPNLTEVCVSCSEDGLTFKNKKVSPLCLG